MQVNRSLGFTLIELVIGIVVLSLSFTILFNTIIPATEQGAKQIHQIRAAELGQTTMSEIMGKAYDENSDMMGGLIRCGESTITCSTELGPDVGVGGDEESLSYLYDDVDDYNGLVISDITNSLDETLDQIYSGFTVAVKVCHDSDYDGTCNVDDVDAGVVNIAKLITITVTTAEGAVIVFSSYKANF